MEKNKSFNAKLHHAICNREVTVLKDFIKTCGTELTQAHVDDKLFFELIERQWDSGTINFFANLGNDRQLAILIASAVLHSHVVSIAPLFNRMRNRADTIDEYHLKDLFLTLCERENTYAIRAFIENDCYDPTDSRPLRAIVRSQLNKSVVDEELLKLVLDSHPKQTENVDWIRKNCFSDAKCAKVLEIVDGYLVNYVL